MFLVVFAVINGNDRLPLIGNQHYLQYYVPAIACFGLMSATYTNLAIGLAMRRETGLLRRMQATPLPRAAFVGGLVGSALVVTLVSWAVMGGVGWALYGATPRHPLPLVVALVLGVATFSAAGAAVASRRVGGGARRRRRAALPMGARPVRLTGPAPGIRHRVGACAGARRASSWLA